MHKFSSILSLLVSLVLIVCGVMVALLEPLAALLPNTEFAAVTVADVETAEASTPTAPYQASENAFVAAELPAFEAAEETDIDGSTVSKSVSSGYLFDYSFGADFYTEIYEATYQIYEQLERMSEGLTSISTATADNYTAQVYTLRAVENLGGLLVNVGKALNNQYTAQTETLSAVQETNAALSTISTQVNELATAQSSALQPVAASLSGVQNALVVIIRLMGAMIAAAGLILLCRSFWKMGDAFAK